MELATAFVDKMIEGVDRDIIGEIIDWIYAYVRRVLRRAARAFPARPPPPSALPRP